ncbi:hypothetical protein JG688_00007545 [Phytophthora aleatoria]|uniref:Uncharacterized protein n=1 Tax=Phytophthora aleatoria TaxID=2496075 RepID=A0A8J5J5U0_9STRA|nr:hypothetical protein JG688_00007545 [Phytophthora aleatoria]
MAKRTQGTPRRTSHTQAPQPNPHATADRTMQRKPSHSAPITETATDTMTPARRSPNKSLRTQDYAALSLYSRNGTPVDFQIAAWLQADMSIRREILTLPLPAVKGKKRKTAAVIGQILTAAMMERRSRTSPRMLGRQLQRLTWIRRRLALPNLPRVPNWWIQPTQRQ